MAFRVLPEGLVFLPYVTDAAAAQARHTTHGRRDKTPVLWSAPHLQCSAWGWLTRSQPGSPIMGCAFLGMGGDPPPATLSRICSLYAAPQRILDVWRATSISRLPTASAFVSLLRGIGHEDLQVFGDSTGSFPLTPPNHKG